ncbi:MAG TPA: acetate/propionate family kinase, partial [Candidatus Binataceae bacterium]|nr:acetate/propionate family kinase [Candidatus Binataceae bacterium]
MRILVFNCGSSTLKFELIELVADDNQGKTLANGLVDRIGPTAELTLENENRPKVRRELSIEGHAEAAEVVLDALGGNDLALDAVAHRVVHGGAHVTEPALATSSVMAALDEASRFAPLHNPPALKTLRAVQQRLPGLPAIVVADTGFHRDLPPHSRTYAIPREMASRHGIRRFGFHGVGHAWMLERYAALSGRPPAALNLITLQLGAGCSVAAIRAGVSVDTSMGLTPLEGLMMATRSGDLDPAILSYLGRAENLTPEQVEHLLNFESGLLGASGRSKDMRELEAAAPTDETAELALAMFGYRVRKYIGAYAAALGRVDAVVFGGGIGEHSAPMRARICSGLGVLGIHFDASRNAATGTGERCVSADDSPTAVWV